MPVSPGAKGVGTPLRQPDRLVSDPIRGVVRYQVFKCVNNDQINALAANYLTLGLPYQIASTGTTHTIEVDIYGGSTDPNTQLNPVDRWEMPPNEIQKAIWEHQKLLAFDPDVIRLAKADSGDGVSSFNDLLADIGDLDDPPVTLSTDEKALLRKFFNLGTKGTDHFALGQYVLKHTTTVGPRYDANIADINVERIYTTAQLLAEVTDPVLWIYPLPGRLQYKIGNLVAPPARDDYLWGWRKLVSGENTIAGGRIEILTEYWLEQWSTVDYELVA